MRRLVSVLLAFILLVSCLLTNLPVLTVKSASAEPEQKNVDAYYYGAGSETCYAADSWPDSLQVTYGEKYGRDIVFQNCANMNVRTYTKETYGIHGLHISIENFQGDGLSFWLSNRGASNAQRDNALRFVLKNGSHLGVNTGTNRYDCDSQIPFSQTVSGKLDIRFTVNQDQSVTAEVNGTAFTVSAEAVAENITDINEVYVQFSTVPKQGFHTASFTLASIHNGDCEWGTIVDNRQLTPKYVPDSQVTVDENGSPDWLSQLVIAEVKVAAASPERTFQGAVRLLDLYEEMGVNGIWLTPIYDGYDFNDTNAGYANAGPHTVHSSLTGTTDYEEGWRVVKEFVDAAHERNIRVFLDAITWGVAYSSPLYTEHPDWFSGTAWGGAAFNWNSSTLREWYISTWVDNMLKTRADGIRCDCEPSYTGYSLFLEVRERLADQGRKIAVMSEHTNTRGTAGSYTYDMEQLGVNVATNTEYNMMMSNKIFMNGASIVRACTSGNMIGSVELQNAGKGGAFKYYTFMLSCHDHQVPCAVGNRAYVGYQAILAPFIPLWFMGEEWNDNAANGVQYCKTLNWDKLYQYENRCFFEDYKKYIAIRWSYPEIFGVFPEDHRETNICSVQTNGGSQNTVGGAYARFGGGKGIIVAMNKFSSTEKTLSVPFDHMQLPSVTEYLIKDLLTGELIAQGSRAELEIFTVNIERDHVGIYLVEAAPGAVEITSSIELTADSTYELTEDYVAEVREGTALEDFICNFKYQDSLRVLKTDGTALQAGSVGTGFILQSVSGGSVAAQKTVIVYGDANGDGKVNSTDYLRLKRYFKDSSVLAGPYFFAMDVSKDGKLTSMDYIKIKAYFSGRTDLYA